LSISVFVFVVILVLFLPGEVELDWVQANDFELRLAFLASNYLSFIRVFIDMDLRFAFRANSQWHDNDPPENEFITIMMMLACRGRAR
jgi:hypothetical protein